jgi:acyl transferase domain-containing protein/SAM-dependent methyltransferase
VTEVRDRIESLSPKRVALLALELEAKLQKVEGQRSGPIAIVGIGCRIPGSAPGPDGFWNLLANGRDGVCEVPADRWDIDRFYDPDPDAPARISTRWGGFLDGPVGAFDAAFFGISRREAVSMDPQHRLLLEVAWEALENAGHDPHALAGSRTGVYVGLSTTDYHHLLLTRGQHAIDAYTASGSAHSIAAARISYVLDLVGPNLAIDTSCSSSLVAVHVACQALRAGECTMALAGGVNMLLSPEISIALSRSHMMACDGRCKAFDERADGFVRGEGCGVVILKRLSDALTDGDNVLAVIRGSAINQDGRSNGITAPNGAAQEMVIRAALADARVAPAEIDYVEAHGTGTALGDPTEAHALAAVLGAGRSVPLLVGSVKASVGHLEAAAGVAGLIKVVLALRHGLIPPQLHFERLNPHIDWSGASIEVAVSGRRWSHGGRPRRAGVSSFGFSGTNAHVVVEEAPEPAPRTGTPRSVHVLPLSARSDSALAELERRYAAAVESGDAEALDLCYTAAVGRAHFAVRAAYIARSAEELQRKLRGGDATTRGRADRPPEVAFLFTGQGAQYAGMGRELYTSEPAFRRVVDECDAYDLLYSAAAEARLDDTRFAQPALFVLQCAVAALWRSWGVQPAAVLGHSVGEYAAACVAGACTLSDGLRLIRARGLLTGGLPAGEGAMAAILAPVEEVRVAVEPVSQSLSIAAVNGPESVVVSGRVAELGVICERFVEQGYRVERLRVSHAFHSPLMEEAARELAKEAGTVAFREPDVRLISTVTGHAVGFNELSRTEYWRRQVRDGVQFVRAIEAVKTCEVFVEIGPGSTLLGLGRGLVGGDGCVWAPSIRRKRGDSEQMAESLAALYSRGVVVDWSAYYAGRGCRRGSAPTYPFERQRYWFDTRPTPGPVASSKCALLGARAATAVPIFEGVVDLEHSPWIRDHRVGGVVEVPVSAYLEIGMALAAQEQNHRRLSVVDMQLTEPLGVTENCYLQTVLLSDGFQIFSRSGDGGWVVRASAKWSAAPEPIASDFLSLQAHVREEHSVEAFYQQLSERGIDLGPACRTLLTLWGADKEALGEISIPADAVGTLESCFRVLQAASLFASDGPSIAISVTRIGKFRDFAPLAGRIFVHAHCADRNSAELRIFSADGELLAEALDVQLTPTYVEPCAPLDWFYRLEWQERPNTIAAAGAIATDPTALEHVQRQSQRLAGVHDFSRYDDLTPQLDRLCAAYARAALDDVPSPLARRYERLYKRLRAIIAQEHNPTPIDPGEECSRLARDFPQFRGELALLRLCGSQLADVFRGAVDPVELLGGAFEILEQIYIESPGAKVLNGTALAAVEAALGRISQDRTVKVLEIGAGTGGTTAVLAPVLAGRAVEYMFTDVSPLFLLNARERFRDYPFFRFSALDIEQAPKFVGAYDIVVAANVLHATADLRRALEHIRSLMAPSGLLLLIEGTRPESWVDLTFGLTDGWWKFGDHELRGDYPLLSRERWIGLLESEGFFARAIQPTPGSQQVLLLARAPTRCAPCILVSAPDSELSTAFAAKFADLTVVSSAQELEQELVPGADVVLDAISADCFLPAILRTVASGGAAARMWLLTRGAQALSDEAASPRHAVQWGLARVAALEHPHFWAATVDFHSSATSSEIVAAVADELSSGSNEDQVAFRADRRYVPRLVRDTLVAQPLPSLRGDGAYLIAGGLGELGRRTAEWLVRHGARQLILVGRTAVPESPTVTALERLGAFVKVVQVDIATDDAVSAIRSALGAIPVRGIVHAAAVFDNTPLVELTQATLDSVLRPKLQGARNLLELSVAAELDFLVFFSSTIGALGARGMGAYAAANAALDAVAHCARSQGIPATSINWGSWEEMRGTSEADRQAFVRKGLPPMPPEMALAALGAVLAAPRTQQVVANIEWTALKAVYEAWRPQPMFEFVSSPETQPESNPPSAISQDLATILADIPQGERLDRTVTAVRQVAATVLALQPHELDPSLGLFEMGMDSLMSVELKRRLEALSGRRLPATLTFNYPNVRSLGVFLLDLLGLASSDPAGAASAASKSHTSADERECLSESELAGLLSEALKSTA